MILYLDFETWSSCPIRRGTDRYLEEAKPLLLTYAVNDGPVQVFDFVHLLDGIHGDFPRRLPELLASADELIAHKAFFDRNVLTRLLKRPTDLTKWRCTMAQALAHGLPGGLDPLCTVLGVPADLAKIKDGKRLIQKFCCGKEILHNDPEWPLFIEYAINDITAMRECHKRMPKWNYQGEELRLWHLDQKINERGFKVDVQLAEEAIKALKTEKEKLDDAIWIQTCGGVTAATQRDKLLLYLCESQGCVLPDLTAPTIREALEDESLDDATREILRIRLTAASTSVSKFRRLRECVGLGDRLRDTTQFAGASRTARWSGKIFQPQNLPRPTLKLGDIRNIIQLIRDGRADLVDLFAPIGQACMNVLRGLIIAGDESDLFVSDYSAIEGRVNAYIAGEDWKTKAFRNDERIYCRVYEQAFGLPYGSISQKTHPLEDQIGKVMELALGFGGGVGAFLNMSAVYHLDLEELGRIVDPEEKSIEAWERALRDGETFGLSREVYTACDTLKLRYRRANPAITQSWYQYEEAARRVIEARDPTLKACVGATVFDCNKAVMRVKLPSGHYLCYWLPKIGGRKRRGKKEVEIDENEAFNAKGDISYMSWRNKQWVQTYIYGGKFCENIVQAVARDLLAFALLNLDSAGFDIVLHIHDEIIAEVARILGLTFEQFNNIMQTRPKWAPGFPLEAKGYTSIRYEKR